MKRLIRDYIARRHIADQQEADAWLAHMRPTTNPYPNPRRVIVGHVIQEGEQ